MGKLEVDFSREKTRTRAQGRCAEREGWGRDGQPLGLLVVPKWGIGALGAGSVLGEAEGGYKHQDQDEIGWLGEVPPAPPPQQAERRVVRTVHCSLLGVFWQLRSQPY